MCMLPTVSIPTNRSGWNKPQANLLLPKASPLLNEKLHNCSQQPSPGCSKCDCLPQHMHHQKQKNPCGNHCCSLRKIIDESNNLCIKTQWKFVSIWQLRFQVVPLSLFFMKQNKKWHVLWNVGSMSMFDVSWHQLGINDFFHNGMVSVALLVLLLGMDIGHSAGGLEQSCLLEVRKVGQPRRFTLAAHTVAQSFLSKSRAEWLAIATCLRFGLELLSRYNCHVPRSSCSWTSVGS